MTTVMVDSAKARLRAWLRGQIDGQQELSLSDLATEALDHFGEQSDFLADFGREVLRRTVYQEAQILIAGTRLRSAARNLPKPDWAKWTEHVGTRHVRLMAMVRADLEQAESERRLRAGSELAIADFFTRLRERLSSPDMPVGAHWSRHELDDEWEAVREGTV